MAENTAPYEIIAAPFTAWVAPTGTAFPDVDAAPAGTWTKIGTSGDLNYTEDGVIVSLSQTIEKWRALGSTGPRKAFRTAEDMMVAFTVADLTLEQFRIVMDYNTVTEVAAAMGTAGTKTLGLTRGLSVDRRALLVRGPSPYGDDMVMQFEVPIAVLESSVEVAGRKNEPAGLKMEWSALEDPSASSDDEKFGRLVAQTADALT